MVLFHTMSQWPRRIWNKDHLAAVGQAIRHALDAADLSHGTGRYIELLVVRLFGVDPEWGSRWLATLLQERGTLYWHRLGDHLTDEEVRIAAPFLLKAIQGWMRRDLLHRVVAVASSLGARMPLVSKLPEILVKAALKDRNNWYTRGILQVLREHVPDQAERLITRLIERRGKDEELMNYLGQVMDAPLPEALVERLKTIARTGSRYTSAPALQILRAKAIGVFDEVLRHVLERDRSFIILPVVHLHIHRRRQDLLDFLLDRKPVKGIFASGDTSWVIPFRDGFFRWPARQCARYEKLLEGVVADGGNDTPIRLRALTILAALFSVEARGLCDASNHSAPVVRERAIRVLSRLDEGQGLNALVECLGDARARFAIYGMRRAILSLPAARAVEILTKVPLYRVTVAKEVVRLFGEIRCDAAYAALIDLSRGSRHRDVRLAMLRALWDHLDREPTWPILEAAATGEDILLATKVGDVPADRLTSTSDRRLSALLARVLERPEPEVRVKLMGRASSLAVRDPERTFWRACVQRLRSRYDDETRAAMMAVMWRSYAADVPVLQDALVELRRDLRSLTVAVSYMLGQPIATRALWCQLASAAEIACEDPRMTHWRVRCAMAWRGASEFSAWVVEQCETQRMDFDGALAVSHVLSAVADAELWRLTTRLQYSTSAVARRLAVKVLEVDVAREHGWTPERVDMLRRLRADADPSVAGAAYQVWPPREVLE